MSLRIMTNTASLMAQHQMGRTQRQTNSALSELATGSRFSTASRDSAGRAVAESLRAQQTGLEVAQRNADIATSFIQTADASLNEQSNILIRQRELAIQAASDTYSNTERGFLDQEFKQLGLELTRIAESTSFGSQKMLNGDSSEFEFQVGVNGTESDRIAYENDTDTTASGLGMSGAEISSRSEARSSLKEIDEAMVKVNGARAKFGATQSRLETAGDFLGSQVQSIAEAHSQLADTDVADAVSRARKGQIMQQYQAAALVQANDLPALGLKLIG